MKKMFIIAPIFVLLLVVSVYAITSAKVTTIYDPMVLSGYQDNVTDIQKIVEANASSYGQSGYKLSGLSITAIPSAAANGGPSFAYIVTFERATSTN